jgi:hypothetical protein
MVDTDEDQSTFTVGSEITKNRDKNQPLVGSRQTLEEPALQKLCVKKDDSVSTDFILNGYQTCALSFTQKQFQESINEENGKKMISLYVNHPQQITSWVETCRTVGQLSCETVQLQQGLEYSLYNDPNF